MWIAALYYIINLVGSCLKADVTSSVQGVYGAYAGMWK